jgi:hypothetical protein
MLRSLVAVVVVAELAGSASAPSGIGLTSVSPAKIDVSFSAVTYDCGNQSPITIVSQGSTVTLNGSCGEVDVSGVADTVNLQTVSAINVTGSGNHVTWLRGPGGGLPKISNSGGNNDIRGPGGFQAG